MNEVTKAWAPVYDSARRPVETVKLDDIAEVGIVFNAYGIKEKEVIEVIKDEGGQPIIAKQAPRRADQNPTYLVAIKRNGNKSWLNPTFFLRQDAGLNPVYPEWSALGNAKAVVEKLLKLGQFTAGANFKVKMTAFNRDGSFKEIAKRDESGNVVLNEDGTPEMIRQTDDRDYPTLPAPPAE